MTKIKEGGQLAKFDEPKLKEIVITADDEKKYTFHLWLNSSSLSYLSLQELIELRDEINEALKTIIK